MDPRARSTEEESSERPHWEGRPRCLLLSSSFPGREELRRRQPEAASHHPLPSRMEMLVGGSGTLVVTLSYSPSSSLTDFQKPCILSHCLNSLQPWRLPTFSAYTSSSNMGSLLTLYLTEDRNSKYRVWKAFSRAIGPQSASPWDKNFWVLSRVDVGNIRFCTILNRQHEAWKTRVGPGVDHHLFLWQERTKKL